MQNKIEIHSNKQIVDKFSKETGIKDPIVDTFIAMQDNMPDLGHYHVLGSQRMNTTYGVDPGYYAGWTWGVNNKQPSGNIFEEVVGGVWAEYLDREINPNKYYDGDWKRAEPDNQTNNKLKLEYYKNQRKYPTDWDCLKP